MTKLLLRKISFNKELKFRLTHVVAIKGLINLPADDSVGEGCK